MKIISEQLIRSLGITPTECIAWVKESFSIKEKAQLPAKISVHPTDTDFFTSMPCLLPSPKLNDDLEIGHSRQYFGLKKFIVLQVLFLVLEVICCYMMPRVASCWHLLIVIG